MGTKKYKSRDLDRPAFKMYYKSNKLNRFDLNIPEDTMKNPNDTYWLELSEKMRLDIYTCYNEFIKQYFKQYKIKWTIDKDNLLLELIKSNISWLEIGFKLSIFPSKCIKRFYKIENQNKALWTENEDKLLLEMINKHGIGRWKLISSFFNDRSRSQCLQRYKKLCECKKKGRWTKEEDDKLLQAANNHLNKGWVFIAQFVIGRNDAQCRERWINALDPSLKKGRWSIDEDDKLKDLVDLHGQNWDLISNEISGRNKNQCQRRYNIINKKN